MQVEDFDLTTDEIQEAIARGVERAMWRMITGITDMPSSDFWETLEESMESAFTKIAESEIEKRSAV